TLLCLIEVTVSGAAAALQLQQFVAKNLNLKPLPLEHPLQLMQLQLQVDGAVLCKSRRSHRSSENNDGGATKESLGTTIKHHPPMRFGAANLSPGEIEILEQTTAEERTPRRILELSKVCDGHFDIDFLPDLLIARRRQHHAENLLPCHTVK